CAPLGRLVDVEEPELLARLHLRGEVHQAAIAGAGSAEHVAALAAAIEHLGAEVILVLDQLHRESRAAIALGSDASAVQLDDLTRQSEANAGSAVPARLSHVDLEEPLEETLGHLGGKARSVLLHH